MFPFLVGDIGGTNARFALARQYNTSTKTFEISDVQVFSCSKYSNLESCLELFLDSIQDQENISSACIAIAAPVKSDNIAMTNLSWQFSIDTLRQHFQWQQLNILNDFAAQAYALPYISSTDLIEIKPGEKIERQVKAVMGPGTGLGVAILTPSGSGWIPVSGEGGHVGLAPVTDIEAEVVRLLLRKFSYVSLETVLCGPGLLNLYRTICEIHSKKTQDYSAREITQLAANRTDSLCAETLNVFCSFLGSSAANLALTSGARGGVYLAGGILPNFVDFLLQSPFGQQFIHKGCMSELVQSIPVQLVNTVHPALIGAAAWHFNIDAK